jgi:hypothetical protein
MHHWFTDSTTHNIPIDVPFTEVPILYTVFLQTILHLILSPVCPLQFCKLIQTHVNIMIYRLNVIVFSFPIVSGNCYNAMNKPIGCFHFDLKDKLAGKHISSAKLWLYKLRDPGDMHNQTIVVSEITNPNHSNKKSGRRIGNTDTPLKRGWMKFDFKSTIYRWIQNPSRNRGIEVLCKTCRMNSDYSPVATEGQYRPFIVMDTENRPKRRVKRSVDCSPSSTVCCRERFYVSFEQLGWKDWVIQPAGYYANYCKGSCAGELALWVTWGISRQINCAVF